MRLTPSPLPLTLHSAEQVRTLDARLIAAGTPGFELMQRAAHAAWRALRRRWPDAGEITVLAVSVPRTTPGVATEDEIKLTLRIVRADPGPRT